MGPESPVGLLGPCLIFIRVIRVIRGYFLLDAFRWSPQGMRDKMRGTLWHSLAPTLHLGRSGADPCSLLRKLPRVIA
jgi:hypothetical protein